MLRFIQVDESGRIEKYTETLHDGRRVPELREVAIDAFREHGKIRGLHDDGEQGRIDSPPRRNAAPPRDGPSNSIDQRSSGS